MVLMASKLNAQQYTDYDLKAAYLFNFTKCVEWPQNTFHDKNDKFVITVLGDSPICPILNKALGDKKICGRKVSIRVVYNIYEIKDSQIIFISHEYQDKYKKITKIMNHKPVLTVGDVISDFCHNGGIINLTGKSEKHRFEINPQRAEQAGLKIKSKLLVLSKVIDE